jgi:hydrogenase maturation factor
METVNVLKKCAAEKMCIGISGLIEKEGKICIVRTGNRKIKVFNFIKARKGDYVYVQGNYVTEIIEKNEVKATIKAFELKKKKKKLLN